MADADEQAFAGAGDPPGDQAGGAAARQPSSATTASFAWITNKICGIVEEQDPRLVVVVLRRGLLHSLASRWPGSPTWSSTGVGVWGHRTPVNWGWDIVELRLLDRHRPRRDADLGRSCASCARSGAPRSTAPPRR